MSKPKFYVGQLVRRKTKNGTPVGPYLRIEAIEDDRVYASAIGEDSPNYMLLKVNTYTPTMTCLVIGEHLLNQLKEGRTVCAQHVATERWLNVCKKPVELIRFYTQRQGYENVYVVERIYQQTSFREKVVRIIVNERIL
jgi:hypothetical protein